MPTMKALPKSKARMPRKARGNRWGWISFGNGVLVRRVVSRSARRRPEREPRIVPRIVCGRVNL